MKGSLALIGVLWVLALICESNLVATDTSYCNQMASVGTRPHTIILTDFGAVGDGVTLNTRAFQNAIFYLRSVVDSHKGGARLIVPAGRWLTGSFSLISHLTLSLDKDAIILGSMDPSDWPIIDPLPSYGRGRELPGGRHRSLLHGYNLTDVTITGNNGTIDGQGSVWWDLFNNKSLDCTRPHLVEFMYSTGVVISNLTFRNSPFWAIHPVYSSQFLVEKVTILAPLNSPNTDGINPDSSSYVCIDDCYISTGNDLIAIESGWDAHGISLAHPSTNISIHRVTGETGSGSGIAFGSEMSGGISDVEAEGIQLFNSYHGIRIKTAPGRGGYVRNIYISDVTMIGVKIAISVTGQDGEHPDDNYDREALPAINGITITNVVGVNVSVAGLLEGIEGGEFSNICLSNLSLDVTTDHPWKCSNIEGYSYMVSPESCEALRVAFSSSSCYRADQVGPQQPLISSL